MHSSKPLSDADVASAAFIGEAAHRIKGPLTTIQLYSEALASGSLGQLSPEQLDYVKEIHQAGQRLITTLKDLESQARRTA